MPCDSWKAQQGLAAYKFITITLIALSGCGAAPRGSPCGMGARPWPPPSSLRIPSWCSPCWARGVPAAWRGMEGVRRRPPTSGKLLPPSSGFSLPGRRPWQHGPEFWEFLPSVQGSAARHSIPRRLSVCPSEQILHNRWNWKRSVKFKLLFLIKSLSIWLIWR